MRTIGIDEVPKKYTIITARQEARRRWGILAFATVSRLHISPKTKKGYRGVGVRVYYPETRSETKEYYGWGDTWEDAFNQATRKGK